MLAEHTCGQQQADQVRFLKDHMKLEGKCDRKNGGGARVGGWAGGRWIQSKYFIWMYEILKHTHKKLSASKKPFIFFYKKWRDKLFSFSGLWWWTQTILKLKRVSGKLVHLANFAWWKKFKWTFCFLTNVSLLEWITDLSYATRVGKCPFPLYFSKILRNNLAQGNAKGQA